MKTVKWFDQQTGEVIENLKADVDRGLAGEEAEVRLAEHGPNELAEAKKTSPLMLFAQQFNNTPISV